MASGAGVRRAAKFFLSLAGILGILGVSGCAVAFAMMGGGGYDGLGVGIFGLFTLFAAAASLVIAGILFLVASAMDRA